MSVLAAHPISSAKFWLQNAQSRNKILPSNALGLSLDLAMNTPPRQCSCIDPRVCPHIRSPPVWHQVQQFAPISTVSPTTNRQQFVIPSFPPPPGVDPRLTPSRLRPSIQPLPLTSIPQNVYSHTALADTTFLYYQPPSSHKDRAEDTGHAASPSRWKRKSAATSRGAIPRSEIVLQLLPIQAQYLRNAALALPR